MVSVKISKFSTFPISVRYGMKRWSLLLIVCIWLPAFAAEVPVYNVQQLDNRNGLSNSAINALFSDSDNLLWAATWDGLNMYDGGSFHVFNYSKDNVLKSIGNNVVLQVTEDKTGYIWLSTIEGVSRYNKKTGRFSNYFYTRQQRSRVSEQEYELLTDTAGQIFCFTQQKGLTRYDPEKDSFFLCNLPTDNNRISKAAFDGTNHLWLLHSDGSLEIYTADYKLIQRFSGVNTFFNLEGQIFYTTVDGDLFSVTPQLKPLLRAHLPHAVKTIILYQDHYLLAWNTQGFGVYDRNFKPSLLLQEAALQVQDMKITAFATSETRLLWCGTDGNGIIKISPRTKYFGVVTRATNGPAYNKPVRAFCSSGNDLWIGTKGNGLIRMSHLNEQQLFPDVLDNNAVFALCTGNDSLIYIGTDGKGICLYDQLKKEFVRWAQISNSNTLPSFGSVYALLPDADGSVWLGTSGYGLIHLRIQRQQSTLAVTLFEQYTFNGTDTGPANDIIYALAHGRDNDLWIGCRYGGLNCFNKQQRKFRTFKAFSYEGSLSHNDVLALCYDQQQRLWVGTSYGLNWIPQHEIQQVTPQFRKFNTGNGLPNNTIHAITQDNNNMIWVSTNKGLARINPATQEISPFQEVDGLQSNEFSDGAVWKNKQGYLFFGGIYGFNYFLPDNIQAGRWYPNLLVSGLQLAGKAALEGIQVLKPGQANAAGYVLKRRDNFFELQLKAISFSHAEKCEYAFFLQGYDKSWHYSGKIAYSNVPPGKYTLKVKWSNGEGVWTPETTMMDLTIQQYFWFTLPAFLLYLLVLGGAGTAFWLYRKNKLEMRHQLAMEHLLRKKEEEVHQEQLGFFTNIAHELQTPLTLIVGAAERSIEKPADGYNMSLVHQQASRLTYLVQQLLEFRRAEAGFLKNYYSQLNVSILLENIAALFAPLYRQKGLRYQVFITPGVIAWMDKDKLEKILFNLLSNAGKHSASGQEVIFRMTVHQQLEISVFNSGSQIPDAQMENIFSRFFAAATHPQASFSAGIGLAFTRQLVNLLAGDISVSNENNGVMFRVILPLGTDKQEDAQLIQEDNMPSYLLQSATATMNNPDTTDNKLSRISSLQENCKKSILIVEDEHAIRYLLKDVLASQYIIYEAGNGNEALELIRQTLPDLIISDIMMPDMDGLELCDRVKNAPSTCHIPFIMLSARGTINQQTEGYEAGADAYIPKPFHAAYLLVRVRKLLEYRQRLHDLFKSMSNIEEEEEMTDTDRQFLQELVHFIEEKLDDDTLNAEQLEKHLHLSKMQLYRKLKALSGMTPAEFIKYIRLKEAAHLLITTQKTVTEIFYCTGFNNQSYFFREFKKLYQCSPNEYREQQTTV